MAKRRFRDRLAEAARAIWQGPIYSSDPNLQQFFGSAPTATGVSVDQGNALTLSPVWAAVNCISGDVSSLPLFMYRRASDGGKDQFTTHPMNRLVHDQPNPIMTSVVWRQTTQAHALTWGNAYSEIIRDGTGRPMQLWPITPDRVSPYWRPDGGLAYRVVERDGSDTFVPAEDMLHIKGLSYDGITGYSVIQKARESIGLGLAVERFGETFFGNGATFGGVLSFKGPRPPELSEKAFRDMLNSRHQGVDRAHKFLALYNAASYTQIGIPPEQAQFLNTRKFQIIEVARWFNVPPHRIGDLERGASYASIEQQNLAYITGTLLPWLKVWEQELNLKLVANSERNIQFFEHVVDGLLRGDSQMRAESYSKQFSTASITPNEIRNSENRNPIQGGDSIFIPLNTMPAHLIDPYYQSVIELNLANAEKARQPPPPPEPKALPPAPRNDEELALLVEVRDLTRKVEDRAATDLAAVRAELEHARTALAQAQAEGEAIIAARAEDVAAHQRQIEGLSLDIVAAKQETQDAEKRLEASQKEVERVTGQATTLSTDLGKAATDVAAGLERIAAMEAEAARLSAEWQTKEHEYEQRDLEAKKEIARLVVTEIELKTNVEQFTRQIADFATRAEALDADYKRVCEERQAERIQSEENASAQRAEIDRLAKQATALGLDLARAVDDLQASEQRTQIAVEETRQVQAELKTAAAERDKATEIHQATVTELRTQLQIMNEAEALRQTALTELAALSARHETQRDEQTAMKDTAETALKAALAQIEAAEIRNRATKDAIRGAIVYEADRILSKEIERARGKQASPAVLGAWVDTFYPLHEDFCRMALRPVVKAALAAHGSDQSADRVLDSVVPTHIGESSRQLQRVIQDSNAESLAPALQGILRRWEVERAEALADRIMKECA